MPNEIKLYGVIGEDVRAVEVKQQLDAMDQTQPLTVRIHSEGGSVPDGLAIYDAFQSYAGPKKAVVESAALSIASYIAMAFEDVEITENGYFMMHNPHMDVSGDDLALSNGSVLLSKLKDSMVQAYSRKTGKPNDEVLAIMANETWVNATEAVAAGWANRIIAPKRMKAVARSMNMPQRVFASLFSEGSDAGGKREDMETKPMSETKVVPASLAEIKAAHPRAHSDFIIKCLERQLPLASVMTDALAAMDDELNALRAKVAEFERESAAKAVEPEEEEIVPGAKAMEDDEEEKVEAKAKIKAKSGVRPVAKSAAGSSSKLSATAQWNEAIESAVPAAKSRVKAVSLVNKKYPGLRQAMLEEANAGR